MNIYLILGCWGHEENQFTLCPSIENKILDLSKKTQINLDILNFLNSYKLFDQILRSNVHTLIYNLQTKFSTKINKVFDNDYYKLLENFCIQHKRCGVYARLLIEEEK